MLLVVIGAHKFPHKFFSNFTLMVVKKSHSDVLYGIYILFLYKVLVIPNVQGSMTVSIKLGVICGFK